MDVETYNENFREIDRKYKNSLLSVISLSIIFIILSLIIFNSFILLIIIGINCFIYLLFLCAKYNLIMNYLDNRFREEI